jgi:hypothetical protein
MIEPEDDGPKQNAPGESGAGSWLQIPVARKQKASWVRAAQREGMKLGGWVAKTLDEAVAKNDDSDPDRR